MATAAEAGLFAGLWNSYLNSLRERPIPTKLATAFSIYSLSKVIATMLNPEKKGLDLKELVKHGSFSAVSVPMMHYYYGWIDQLFAGKEGAWVLITQLVIDQVLFSPFFYVVYYVYMGLINGKLHEVPRQISKELIPTSIDSAKFWTIVQFVNFKFVPVELRILFGNVMNLLWSVYWILQMDKSKKDDKKK